MNSDQKLRMMELNRKPLLNFTEIEKKNPNVSPYTVYKTGEKGAFWNNSPSKAFVEKPPSVYPLSGKGRKARKPKNSDMEGMGFWSDFGQGFLQGLEGVANVASKVAPLLPLVGLGEKKTKGRPKKNVKNDVDAIKVDINVKNVVHDDSAKKNPYESSSDSEKEEKGGKMKKPKKQLNDKMKRRADKVKEIMQKFNLSLKDASKKIKDENIDY